MSERYSRLFALPENLYAAGSPVVIAAGALLKDNQTGKVIAQLKIRNISGKTIKAAAVYITPFDTVGKVLGAEVRYQYLDLSANRGNEFGQKTPVVLPDNTARSFAATVKEVAFADNTLWTATDAPWETLPVPSPLSKYYGAEFEKQFRLKYGADCINFPLCEKDTWYCACGALNRQEDTLCHACSKSFAVITGYDVVELIKEKDQRLAEEKAKAESEAEQARIKAEQEAELARIRAEQARIKTKEMARKAKKPAIIAAGVLAAILLIIHVVIPGVKYLQADNMVKAGQFDEAIAAYLAMEESEKREERICAAHYAYAEALLTQEEFEKAVTQFINAGDYEDAKQRVSATYYAYAEALLAQEEFEKAVSQFTNAGDYEDAKQRVSATYYAHAEALLAQEEFEKAISQFKKAGKYSDAQERIKATTYAHAEYLITKDNFSQAITLFESLGSYKDAADRIKQTKYAGADYQVSAHQRYTAYLQFKALGGYSDAAERAAQLKAELEQALSIELVYFNTNKKDFSGVDSSIPNDTNYLHYGFKVNGLHSGEKIELVQVFHWPGEQKKISEWTWEDVKSGKLVENVWKNGYEPDGSGSFKVEIHIYDSQKSVSDATKPIGKFSMNVQPPIKKSSGINWGIGGSTTGVSSLYGGVSIW